MKIVLKVFLIWILICESNFAFGASSFDFKQLLNPDNYKNVDTTYYSKTGRAVDIKYDSMGVESRKKVWNVSIPQTVVIKNLHLTAYWKGINDEELERLNYPIPFSIVVENGFALTIKGKNRTMTISSTSASLNDDNSLSIKGNITIGIDGKSTLIGQVATLRQFERTICINVGKKTLTAKF